MPLTGRRSVPEPQVHSVTSAATPRSSDQSRRQRQYLLAMAIRFVCFVLAIVLPIGVITWVLIAGAVVLPYFAVILANSSATRAGDDATPVGPGIHHPGTELPSLLHPLPATVTLRTEAVRAEVVQRPSDH